MFGSSGRRALLTSVSVCVFAVSISAAYAQDGVAQNNAGVAETKDDETIVVTGSRIRRLDFSSPSPIVSLDASKIQQAGSTNLATILAEYPALAGSSTSYFNSGDRAGIGATGLNLLNLRNLGEQRTLVLVDGRRHVSGVDGLQAVDINTIPSDLVESVDILTGGASAVYGADGVTGVVNFKLKQNFEGLTAHAQAGLSGQGDAGQRLIGFTAGKNFAGGRGNIAVAFEHSEEDRLQTSDRSRLSGTDAQIFALNPNADGTSNNPTRIPLRNVRYDGSSPDGAVITNFLHPEGPNYFYPSFTGTGKIWDPGNQLGEGLTEGGSATLVSRYGNDLLPRIRRNIVNAMGHFDVSDKLTLFFEGKYADIRSFSLAQPTFDYSIFVAKDNPYIPENISKNIDPEAGGVLVNRDNFDLGQRGENIRRQTFRGVIGARGDISPSFHYELSYVYGKTKIRSEYLGDQYSDRFFAAVDAVRDPATGQITCRANIDPNWEPFQPAGPSRTVLPRTTFSPGQCVPINLFGEHPDNTAGINFITAPTVDRSSVEQQVISGSISGDFRDFFSLPGGPIGFALGGEYRKEKSSFVPDELEQQGLTFTNIQLPTKGSFDVKEVFGELNAPIAKDVPFIHDLEVGAAIRYSDYSTIGKTTTWKVDGMYAPIKDITFRGAYSVAIRAPNISELFAGTSQTYQFFDDPCNQVNLKLGTSYRAANCAALLSGLGANPSTYNDNRSFSIAGTQGGNPDLKSEKAKTWTAGIVLSPSFLRGLTISADWYNINLTNAINTVDPQQLAELCVDQPNLSNVFCQSIRRQNGNSSTASAGNIVGFAVAPQNVASFKTAGLDLNVNYRLHTEKLGNFDFRLVGSYLDKLTFVGTPGADPTDERGVISTSASVFAPKYQAKVDLTWQSGAVTLNYGLSWFSRSLRYSHLIMDGDPNYVAPEYARYKERWLHDFYVAVDVNEQFQIYGGVNNAFNQKPDVASANYPVDSVGRYFYAGARIKMPKLF